MSMTMKKPESAWMNEELTLFRDNVRKFMQFQLTINITLCFIVFLSGVTLGNSPFNVI